MPLAVRVEELKPGDRFSFDDPRNAADEFEFIGAALCSEHGEHFVSYSEPVERGEPIRLVRRMHGTATVWLARCDDDAA